MVWQWEKKKKKHILAAKAMCLQRRADKGMCNPLHLYPSLWHYQNPETNWTEVEVKQYPHRNRDSEAESRRAQTEQGKEIDHGHHRNAFVS